MTNGDKLKVLFLKYYQGKTSPAEEAELMQFIRVLPDDDITNLLEDIWNGEHGEEDIFDPQEREKVFKRIEKKIKPRRRIYWSVAAALAMAVIGISLYLGFNQQVHHESTLTASKGMVDSIKPGTNVATFISSEGNVTDLTLLEDGETQSQLEGTITKSGDGLIAYQPKDVVDASSSWNELRTPYGGQFQLSLPDGSKVWLNANSSISFPSKFSQQKREVKVSGEVYFEVEHNPRHPFLVTVGDTEIQVLGTSFNVSGYADDQKTAITLVNGSVNVKKDEQLATLRPGEQAISRFNTPLKIKRPKNLSTVTGWKDGVFAFDDTDISEIMKQISRWYNVKVVFEGNLPQKKLTGSIDRRVELQHMLEMLAYSGLRFDIRNKEITVSEH